MYIAEDFDFGICQSPTFQWESQQLRIRRVANNGLRLLVESSPDLLVKLELNGGREPRLRLELDAEHAPPQSLHERLVLRVDELERAQVEVAAEPLEVGQREPKQIG